MGCTMSQQQSPPEAQENLRPTELTTVFSQVDPEKLARGSKKYRKGDVKRYYKFLDIIAEGGFAQVIEVMHKSTKTMYACKVMRFPDSKQPDPEEMTRDDIFREIAISADLDHKNIVRLVEFYFDKKKVYLVFEKMMGGRLVEVVQKRPSEDKTIRIFRQLIEGIQYLHSKEVTHRDLKLENILLERTDDLESVKIADFGLAKKTSKPLQTMCGTLYYVAPEVISEDETKAYGKSVDMWSAGVLLYLLLSGTQPFGGNDSFDKILQADYGFDKPEWNTASEKSKELVCMLLEIDSNKRLTAQQVLEHEFMKG